MANSLQLRFGDQNTAVTGWGQCDLVFDGHDIETAVIASLFTWRRPRPDDRIDDALPSIHGWWAEDFGSRLYLLSRRSAGSGTTRLARGYIEESLQWLVDRGIVSSIAVRAELHPVSGHLYVEIGLARDENNALSLVYQNLFEYLH